MLEPVPENSLDPANTSILRHFDRAWREVWQRLCQREKIVQATTRDKVKQVYNESNDRVTRSEGCLLHTLPIDTILNWTQRHLEAYLATAEVILTQNVDPG